MNEMKNGFCNPLIDDRVISTADGLRPNNIKIIKIERTSFKDFQFDVQFVQEFDEIIRL